ncbi:MAG TPA: PTS sugar transporter subunit IIC [Candidatus Copromorpha excrementipullorum]|uniref:PTS sugar transporter subunit IIC n=1 Tax=Candidatus Allocopromorpha excrementipullorum TaxID=2840743 RepID=A0A9D1SU63_9FIRM|nr:PTS sugar transporter subunit IIC [Candidatus Copromorpha excrementipullorum]
METKGSVQEKESFFKRKDIEISVKRYLQDALSAMALGLFASLLIGVIFNTIGEQTANLFGENMVSSFFVEVGGIAQQYMGAAIGVAVAWSLKAPPLVLFTSVVTGMMGATMLGFGIEVSGGPAGAFLAVAVGAEFGKMVSKETKVDILVTPAVTLITGAVVAKLAGPAIGWCMMRLGDVIMTATEWQPFIFGIVISVIVGLVLTAPISSAALCIMLDLSGLAAGAATVGCCAQMVGFAVASYRENGAGGLVAQGLGTSMLQVSNIIKNPWILVPATLAGAIIGPISTCIFKMTNIAVGAGMGTSGLVGQIGTFTDMGFSLDTLWKVLLLQIFLPAILTLIIDRALRKMGKIKDGDYKLEL